MQMSDFSGSEEDVAFDNERMGLGVDDDDSGEDESELLPSRPIARKTPAAYASKMPIASKRPRAAATKAIPSKRPKLPNEEMGSDSEGEEEEEVEEEEELEEEEEDEAEETSSKKKRNNGREAISGRYFIEEAAEEVDDDEDEDDDDDVEAGFDPSMVAIEQNDASIRKQARALHFDNETDDVDNLQKLARGYEERYARQKSSMKVKEDLEDSSSALNLLPSIRDPKLWLVKCKPGKERAVVIGLMSTFYKSIRSNNLDDEIFIKSAFTTDSSPGYVYVEADKEVHVRKAIESSLHVYGYKITLVPINEMVPALKVRKQAASISIGQWVRVKRGIYKEDIGQVISVMDQGTQITLRLVPRLDFSGQKTIFGRSKSGGRFPAKLFSVSEAKKSGGYVETRAEPVTGKRCYLYNGNYYRKGFLIKTFSVSGLITTGVAPTVVELELFQSRPVQFDEEEEDSDDQDDEDLGLGVSRKGALSGNDKAVYSRGDNVRVIKGDLKNLTGTVISVFNESIRIKPHHEELTEPLDFLTSDVSKFFKLGDHVKILNGEFVGETGLIVRVEDSSDAVVVFSDISNREMRALSKDIIESSEVTTGVDTLGNYELYDLVAMQKDQIGIIVRVEHGSFGIMDTKGVVHRVRLQDVVHKRNSKFAVALDIHGNQIQRDGIVNVVGGFHKGKQGTIKHIYRSFVFMLSRELTENGGIFVVRSRDCAAVGSSIGNMNSSFGRHGGMGPPSGPLTGGPRKHAMALGKDPLLSEVVTISSGPYKGLKGMVKEALENVLRIELQSMNKVVTVGRGFVRQVTGAPLLASGIGQMPPSLLGSQTPGIGSQTPLDGSATPYSGGMTPGGSATPGAAIWGSQTPAGDYGYLGSQTPMASGFSASMDDRVYTPRTPNTPYGMTPSYLPNAPLTPATGGFPETPIGVPVTPSADTPYTPVSPGAPMTPYTPLPHSPYDHPENSYINPVSPGYGVDESASAGVPWAYVGVCVSDKATQAEAVILEVIRNNQVRIRMEADSSERICSTGELELTSIGKNDNVIVVTGASAGKTGTLIGVDGNDGIVNIPGLDITILELGALAKHKSID